MPTRNMRAGILSVAGDEDFIVWGDGLQLIGDTVSVDLVANGGLKITSGEIEVDDANVDHDALANYSIEEHRIINDAGSAVTDLWSADKITTELATEVDGPDSSTDNAIARFDGTTGKIIQNSGVIIDDSNNIIAPDGTTVQVDQVRARDGDGLKLYDDGNNGIFVKDGGCVGIDTVTPTELLEIDYGNFRMNQEPAAAACSVAVNPAAGNLNGAYRYKITFVTALGETQAMNYSAEVSPANEQVDLTNIPLGTSRVTARKVYRTAADAGWPYPSKLVTTISDNTTTIYTDNTADGGLGAAQNNTNDTGGIVKLNANKILEINQTNSNFGYLAGYLNTGANLSAGGALAARENTGNDVSGFGNYAAYQNTGDRVSGFGYYTAYLNTGNRVSGFGVYAARENTGIYVSGFGAYAAYLNEGDRVSGFGFNAARENTRNYVSGFGFYAAYLNEGDYVSGFGAYAAYLNTGHYVSGFGYYTAYLNTGVRVSGFGAYAARENTGNDVVAIGYQAGYQNTVANQFIVKQANINAVPLIQGNFSTGNLGIGLIDADTKLEVLHAGTQLKLSYDATNYATLAVQSDGDLTIDSNKASYNFGLGDGNLLTTGQGGFGTLTPTAKLDVENSNQTNPLLRLGNTYDSVNSLSLPVFQVDSVYDPMENDWIPIKMYGGGIIDLQYVLTGDVVIRLNTAGNSYFNSSGNLGIGETAPETLLEMSHTAPYLTLHNTTEEDGDYGRECRIIAKGEQSGTEETTLGMIEFAHDGVADDQKGIFTLKLNDGTDGDSPTAVMTVQADGNFGIGVTDPDAKLEVLHAGTQLKLSYDATNYATLVTESDGDLTIDSNKASYNLDLGDGNFLTSGIIFTTGILTSGLAITNNHHPAADDTFYLGKNDDDSPAAWKGLILKDQTDGKYYRIELNSGAVSIVDLTD